MREDLTKRLSLAKRIEKMMSLGIWSDRLAQPDPQILERIQRLNSDIEEQIFELYLPDGVREQTIQQIRQGLYRESQNRQKTHQKKPSEKLPYGYLGDNVSDKLNQREPNIKKLEELGLPIIIKLEELAQLLDTSPKRLVWFSYHEEITTTIHYSDFTIDKGNGQSRAISKPCKAMNQIQQHIKTEILDKLKFQSYIHGFVAGHNIYDNARAHANSRSLVTVDIKDFFGSINFQMVRAAFHRLGYSYFIATLLALLTTKQSYSKVEIEGTTYWRGSSNRSLPQGSSTSPAISNLVAQKFDSQLFSRAENLNFKYTRYADDLTFSTSKEKADHAAILYLTKRTLDLHGFEVNPNKVKILFPHHQQQVTGLNINSGSPTVPRKWRRRLRAAVHQFRFIEDREEKEKEYFRIMGCIQYLKLSHPRKAQQYQIEINRYYQLQ